MAWTWESVAHWAYKELTAPPPDPKSLGERAKKVYAAYQDMGDAADLVCRVIPAEDAKGEKQ